MTTAMSTLSPDRQQGWLRAFWRAAYDHLGGFGVFFLVVFLIPMTVTCLVNRRWELAWIPPVVGWLMIRMQRAEDRKREEAQVRRAEVRAMVDELLSSGQASCELTREQMERIRQYL